MPRQPDLLPRSKSPTIPVAKNHRLVQIADTLDWEELQQRAQQIRLAKLKNAAGQPPHLRATLGAMLFMATRSSPIGRRKTHRILRRGAFSADRIRLTLLDCVSESINQKS